VRCTHGGVRSFPVPRVVQPIVDRLRATPPSRTIGAVAGGTVIAVAAWWMVRVPPPPVEATLPTVAPAAAVTTISAATSARTLDVVVHVAGEVRNPGVYSLSPGARVVDALAAAGGPTASADVDRVNLAVPLGDAVQVYVPRRGRRTPSRAPQPGVNAPSLPALATGAPGAAAGSALVSLNSATAQQLDDLPGVGPATAAAIIGHRERNGPFVSVDELLAVPGIGPSKLARLRDLVVP